MDALSVNPLGPASVNAVGALRAPSLTAPASSPTLTVQDLVQTLFQQSLQAATRFPLAESASGILNLAPEATASLLASLRGPQAAASTAAVPNATPGPPAIQPSAETRSTAPSPNPAASVLGETLPVQDAFATSSSIDFALEAALRFGSGVAGSNAPTSVSPSRSADLVRDAASVISTGNVQPHGGGPGPEVFLRAQANLTRLFRDYQAVSIPAQLQPVSLDLMA